MGVVIWFTGLSGSGKTTLAHALRTRLEQAGESVYVLDGDEVRKLPGRNFGFSREDIRENNKRIATWAKEKAASYDVVLVSVISPYAEDRAVSRSIIGDTYREVFVDCPLAVCIKRDTKGLYAKAKSGELQNVIGMSESNPYERPASPEMTLRTDRISIEEGVTQIVEAIRSKVSTPSREQT